jgi:hypothetical protein
MSNQLLSSKITIEEEEPEIRQIENAATSILGLVGITERGPYEPKLITGVEDYRRYYGGYHASGEIAQAIDGFFGNGGTQCYVQRITHFTDVTDPSTAASVAASLATNLKTSAISATAGAVTGSIAGPWALADTDTLSFSIDGGGSDVATFNCAPADEECANAETYALTDGWTLTLKVNQGPVQTVTFNTSEFVAIGAATAEEVAAVINAEATGIQATVTSGGTKVTITTDRQGTGAYLEITGGTANAALGFATAETQGTGDAVDSAAVTAAEMKTLIEGDVTGCTVSEAVGGYLTVTSNTTGVGSSVQVEAASTADDELGFDNATHSGTATATPDTMSVAAKTHGAYGNSLSIKIEAATSGDADRFNLVVMKGTIALETWSNLSMLDTDNDYVETVVNDANNGSWYITVTDLDAGGTATQDRPANGTFGPMTLGNDGLSALADTDFVGGSGVSGRTGLRGLDSVHDLRLVAVPGRATSVVQNAVITYCEVTRSGSCFAVLDPPSNLTPEAMITYVETTASLLNLSEYGSIYWPRIEVANPSTTVFGSGETIYVAPSGYVAGVMARKDTSSEKGVYESAAGVEEGVIFNCLGFENNDTELEEKRDLLYPKRINPITTLPGRPRFIDGSRTLKAGGNFPSVSERRGVIFIEQSIKAGLEWARHKNNDEDLREQASASCEQFLITQMNLGAFRSRDPDTAFFVNFGEALNPTSAQFAGKMYGRIGLATQKPAEFIILRFAQDTRAFAEAQ